MNYDFQHFTDIILKLKPAFWGQSVKWDIFSCLPVNPCCRISFELYSRKFSAVCTPSLSLKYHIKCYIFRLPIKDEIRDDYSGAMKAEEHECSEIYGKTCPISILYHLIKFNSGGKIWTNKEIKKHIFKWHRIFIYFFPQWRPF